jgi:hypothetical protein
LGRLEVVVRAGRGRRGRNPEAGVLESMTLAVPPLVALVLVVEIFTQYVFARRPRVVSSWRFYN